MGVKKTIGKRISSKRIELGLTQEDLAFRSGLSVNTVSAVENGKVYVKLNNLFKICKHLDIKMVDLFVGY